MRIPVLSVRLLFRLQPRSRASSRQSLSLLLVVLLVVVTAALLVVVAPLQVLPARVPAGSWLWASQCWPSDNRSKVSVAHSCFGASLSARALCVNLDRCC